ncbi:MAG: sigma-70 family RNA polymerase sigma factor [Lachnospiraceae bacterium]|nr:sigma-70 family RNA polymerase sigma factor [Lachnospiraceae bacterium]
MKEMELVKNAAAGDDQAFVALYEIYYVQLYQYAYYTLRTEEDAKDAVAEAVADAYQGIRKIKKYESFRSWIFTILRSKCNQRMKDYYKYSYDARDEEREADEVENAHGKMLRQDGNLSSGMEEMITVRDAWGRLNEKERDILSLSIFAGYESGEIGRMLSENASTVRSIRKRALEKLRKLLGEPQTLETSSF